MIDYCQSSTVVHLLVGMMGRDLSFEQAEWSLEHERAQSISLLPCCAGTVCCSLVFGHSGGCAIISTMVPTVVYYSKTSRTGVWPLWGECYSLVFSYCFSIGRLWVRRLVSLIGLETA